MARRERERYTERARPQRRSGAEPVETDAPAPGLGNPVVLVAVGGLVMAVILAVGFMIGRGGPGTETGAALTPGATPMTDGTAPAAAPEATALGTAPAGAPPPAAEGMQFEAPADQALDPAAKAYFATIETPHGPIVLELWPEVAPQHVNSFVFLSRQGFYDGLTFHRVEPEFVIQGGDPAGDGSGGPGYSLPGEFNADNPVPHRAGTLAMARTSDPDSAGSQFYIVTKDGAGPTGLDGEYTVFGHVVSGMAAVHAMQAGDVMTSVSIEEKPKAESVVSPDDIRAGTLPAND